MLVMAILARSKLFMSCYLTDGVGYPRRGMHPDPGMQQDAYRNSNMNARQDSSLWERDAQGKVCCDITCYTGLRSSQPRVGSMGGPECRVQMVRA